MPKLIKNQIVLVSIGTIVAVLTVAYLFGFQVSAYLKDIENSKNAISANASLIKTNTEKLNEIEIIKKSIENIEKKFETTDSNIQEIHDMLYKPKF